MRSSASQEQLTICGRAQQVRASFGVVLAMALLTVVMYSCAPAYRPTKAERKSSELEKKQDLKMRAWKEEFLRKLARYEVSSAQLPHFEKKHAERFSAATELFRTGGSRLTLHLGARTASEPYRTESRYRLTNPRGELLAVAESTLSKYNISGDSVAFTEVYFDAARNEILIFEELCWTTHRYIVFRPRKDGLASVSGEGRRWEVRYVMIPHPQNPFGIEEQMAIGIHDGRVYLKCFDHYFAIPVDDLESDSDLGFKVG